MRKITTISVFLWVCLDAAGQTPITYTVPPGTSCTTTLNGCTLHNLTTTAPTVGLVCGWNVLYTVRFPDLPRTERGGGSHVL